jgi:hypothetical protein
MPPLRVISSYEKNVFFSCVQEHMKTPPVQKRHMMAQPANLPESWCTGFYLPLVSSQHLIQKCLQDALTGKDKHCDSSPFDRLGSKKPLNKPVDTIPNIA